MHFEIKHRWSGTVLFSCELEASYESKSTRVQLGAAVKLAVSADADLAGADLADADLAGANLAGAYLADAYLAGADLAGADLADAYLAGADLADANLAGANLAGANLADAVKIEPSEIPVIPNIDAEILKAIEAGGKLDMSTWHRCGTTHCRAGWAVHLAGPKGYALEERVGPQRAGAMIYRASRPGQRAPWFFDSTEGALADIRKCAAEQVSTSVSPETEAKTGGE